MHYLPLLFLLACGPKPSETVTAPTATAPVPDVAEVSPTASAQPGLNERFLDPELKVDEWVKRFEAESREVVAQQPEILAALELAPGQSVADIGAGTGLYLAPFAEAVGAEGRVFAVDISPKFIEHLDALASEGGLSQVQTVLATERSAELEAASVDVVFICDTYHHFAHPDATLSSLYEAIRPGGKLVLLDFEREEGVSSDWILKHVRAGKEVFSAEIEAAGFEPGTALDAGLADNYLLEFRRP